MGDTLLCIPTEFPSASCRRNPVYSCTLFAVWAQTNPSSNKAKRSARCVLLFHSATHPSQVLGLGISTILFFFNSLHPFWWQYYTLLVSCQKNRFSFWLRLNSQNDWDNDRVFGGFLEEEAGDGVGDIAFDVVEVDRIHTLGVFFDSFFDD
jgi:hypothetical protein